MSLGVSRYLLISARFPAPHFVCLLFPILLPIILFDSAPCPAPCPNVRHLRTMIATAESTIQKYVLVMNQGTDDLERLDALLTQLRCPVEWANTPEQAMRKALKIPPYLIILAGSPYDWSQGIVHRFRSLGDRCSMTIVALTDFHAPSWLHQEENPGIDGFLVKPIDQDVLRSVVHSAWARQSCSASTCYG